MPLRTDRSVQEEIHFPELLIQLLSYFIPIFFQYFLFQLIILELLKQLSDATHRWIH